MTNIDEEILEKLDVLVRVSVMNVIQNKPFREQVRILSLAGLKPKEIADLLGKTSNHVSVTINELKKR